MAIAGRVAIVSKGDWSADATYKRLDAVTYNNTLYFAKKEVPAGTATSNTEYWSKSIVGGAGAIATKEDAGIVKPTDGLSIAEDGTLKVNIDGATLTMDQVNNVIKLSDTLKDKINGAFPAANLINNLTTTEAGFGLDARQGKALDDKITEINGSLNKADENALGNWMVGYSVFGAGFVIPIPSINNISLSNKKVKIFTTSGWQECTSQPDSVVKFGSGYNVFYNKGLPENLEIGKAFLCQFISRS